MEELSSNSAITGFAFYLSEKKILDKETALDAVKQSAKNKISYNEYLINQRLIKPAAIAKATSEYFGLPLCDISAFNLDKISSEYLNIPFVRKHQALPIFAKNDVLYLAVVDPTLENLDEVRFLTGLDVRLIIADGSKLYQVVDSLMNTMMISEISGKEIKGAEGVPDIHKEHDLSSYDADSAPVVNYVNKIITDAIEKGASDIHFERYDKEYRIRYRIHGVLFPVTSPPVKIANYLLARIKIMSNLDITEHRLPQDGRFKLALSKHKSMDFRVSVCPTLYGEKVVLRLLDPTQIFHSLDDLGMETKQKEGLLHALSSTQGIILVTGPTGAGKTVTLYSALNYLNSPDDNIMTVEDPVEIPLHGINQVHVNPKVGLNFAAALRSFLRQDPDIIMVGEVRDLETGQISVQAAQTGHLVLSTLHTNSCVDTISRLMYMGIEPYNIASSLLLVMAQRLLRVLCSHCKQKEELPRDILLKEGFSESQIGTFQLYKAGSCDRCMHGYKGRTGIFEVMPISDEMRFLIIRNASSMELEEQAKKENIIDLRTSGLDKIIKGETSLAELNRTFK